GRLAARALRGDTARGHQEERSRRQLHATAHGTTDSTEHIVSATESDNPLVRRDLVHIWRASSTQAERPSRNHMILTLGLS
ncbi:hypothetical protein O3G_MSEX001146, partial [Manduca sexta]